MHEQDDRVFVAIIAQDDADRPGIAACELGLAPESLDDYRTRIDSNARQHGRTSGKLASNRLITDARGDRLETVWEFHPDAGGSGMKSPSGSSPTASSTASSSTWKTPSMP